MLNPSYKLINDTSQQHIHANAGRDKEDVSTQRGAFRMVGLNAEMQWSVFNLPLRELREYDVFKPTPYFMKTHVPFFAQYAQVK